jgi:hypothetical protein
MRRLTVGDVGKTPLGQYRGSGPRSHRASRVRSSREKFGARNCPPPLGRGLSGHALSRREPLAAERTRPCASFGPDLERLRRRLAGETGFRADAQRTPLAPGARPTTSSISTSGTRFCWLQPAQRVRAARPSQGNTQQASFSTELEGGPAFTPIPAKTRSSRTWPATGPASRPGEWLLLGSQALSCAPVVRAVASTNAFRGTHG